MIKQWLQKYLIYILLVGIALLLVILGIQTVRVAWKQNTIEKQKGEIELKDVDIKAKQNIISFHEKEIIDNIKMQKNQQNIINEMAKKFSEVEIIDNQTKCMGEKDEKYLYSLYGDYNDLVSGRVSSTGDKSTADSKEVH